MSTTGSTSAPAASATTNAPTSPTEHQTVTNNPPDKPAPPRAGRPHLTAGQSDIKFSDITAWEENNYIKSNLIKLIILSIITLSGYAIWFYHQRCKPLQTLAQLDRDIKAGTNLSTAQAKLAQLVSTGYPGARELQINIEERQQANAQPTPAPLPLPPGQQMRQTLAAYLHEELPFLAQLNDEAIALMSNYMQAGVPSNLVHNIYTFRSDECLYLTDHFISALKGQDIAVIEKLRRVSESNLAQCKSSQRDGAIAHAISIISARKALIDHANPEILISKILESIVPAKLGLFLYNTFTSEVLREIGIADPRPEQIAPRLVELLANPDRRAAIATKIKGLDQAKIGALLDCCSPERRVMCLQASLGEEGIRQQINRAIPSPDRQEKILTVYLDRSQRATARDILAPRIHDYLLRFIFSNHDVLFAPVVPPTPFPDDQQEFYWYSPEIINSLATAHNEEMKRQPPAPCATHFIGTVQAAHAVGQEHELKSLLSAELPLHQQEDAYQLAIPYSLGNHYIGLLIKVTPDAVECLTCNSMEPPREFMENEKRILNEAFAPRRVNYATIPPVYRQIEKDTSSCGALAMANLFCLVTHQTQTVFPIQLGMTELRQHQRKLVKEHCTNPVIKELSEECARRITA